MLLRWCAGKERERERERERQTDRHRKETTVAATTTTTTATTITATTCTTTATTTTTTTTVTATDTSAALGHVVSDSDAIFGGCGALVFVIDAQDDYMESLAKLHETVTRAYKVSSCILANTRGSSSLHGTSVY